VIGHQGLNPEVEEIVQDSQAVGIHFDDGDVGSQPHCHFGGVDAHHSAAHDGHFARQNSWDAGQEHAFAAILLAQEVGADLDGHSAGNFTHGRQQGQCAVRQLHGFVSYAHHLFLQQRPGQFGLRSQVQVGEKYLALFEQVVFGGLGLFNLDDHVRGLEDFGCGVDYACAGGRIALVAKAAAHSGGLFHQYLMSFPDQGVGPGRSQRHPVFVVFDLLGYANNHFNTPPCVLISCVNFHKS